MISAEEFARRFIQAEFRHRGLEKPATSKAFTKHLSQVGASLAENLGFLSATKAVADASGRKEYLNLDLVMLPQDVKTHPQHATGSSYPLPAVTMEFENKPSRLHYDYWKLLCVRSRLRVLTYVVPKAAEIVAKADALAAMRREHENMDGEDLLLGGRFYMAHDRTPWAVFVWKQGEFRQIDRPGRTAGWMPLTTKTESLPRDQGTIEQ